VCTCVILLDIAAVTLLLAWLAVGCYFYNKHYVYLLINMKIIQNYAVENYSK